MAFRLASTSLLVSRRFSTTISRAVRSLSDTSDTVLPVNSNVNTRHLLDLIHDLNFPIDDLTIYSDFVSENEELNITQFLDKKLRRIKYSDSHFDQVITGYRELAISDRMPAILDDVFHRMKRKIAYDGVKWKPLHVLDLSAEGSIGAHVDNHEYSGGIVSGVCLSSSAVMTFSRINEPEKNVKVLLPRRCFYVTRGEIRYGYKHEISSDKDGIFRIQTDRLGLLSFKKDRRISLILRDEKQK